MGRVLSSLAGCGKLTAVALLALLTVMLMGLPLKLDLRSARDGAALRRWVRQHEGRDVEIPSNLLIGLATAPAHVEDQLEDSWLPFARDKGGVAAWHNAVAPEDRLLFWTRPEDDLDLAADAKAEVLRLGVDWARLFPEAPANGSATEPSEKQREVLARYTEILKMSQARGMKVMITLFHHSLPPWSAEAGGWPSERTIDDFVLFSRFVVDAMGPMVDFWTVFNEPHVYVMLTHCAGAWPPGVKDPVTMATCPLPNGAYQTSLRNMAAAHSQVYDYIKDAAKRGGYEAPPVGAAHHVNVPTPYRPWDMPASAMMHDFSTFFFPDLISDNVDFIGVNFYGQEIVMLGDIKIAPHDEYSEAGRAVYPDGLYLALVAFHRRYGVPLWVTENGVADSTDHLRGPYLLEHLMAVTAATAAGADIRGYLFWTISDNWEWADGYCPKFGLADVKRGSGNDTHPLPRVPRPSLGLFAEVASTKVVSAKARAAVWGNLMERAQRGEQRPICRAIHGENGMSAADGLDEPMLRAWVARDWRLGHYKRSGLPWHATPELLLPLKPYLLRAWAALRSLVGDTTSSDKAKSNTAAEL
mmetsp:Transcript_36939/g.94463  ORF Transcript_36939/g.94463 Transcript_36939/m.94463 type:complete len:584 (-) Transcript_36939:63-1814(-)|eukprot:jgi/Tetstr1/432696/TSEL_022063.t1